MRGAEPASLARWSSRGLSEQPALISAGALGGLYCHCLFPLLPQETPTGQSFHPPPDEFGAVALGTVPGTSSRLGGSVNSSGRKREGGGGERQGGREERKRKRPRASMSA